MSEEKIKPFLCHINAGKIPAPPAKEIAKEAKIIP
jgi:hypothetical protein